MLVSISSHRMVGSVELGATKSRAASTGSTNGAQREGHGFKSLLEACNRIQEKQSNKISSTTNCPSTSSCGLPADGKVETTSASKNPDGPKGEFYHPLEKFSRMAGLGRDKNTSTPPTNTSNGASSLSSQALRALSQASSFSRDVGYPTPVPEKLAYMPPVQQKDGNASTVSYSPFPLLSATSSRSHASSSSCPSLSTSSSTSEKDLPAGTSEGFAQSKNLGQGRLDSSNVMGPVNGQFMRRFSGPPTALEAPTPAGCVDANAPPQRIVPPVDMTGVSTRSYRGNNKFDAQIHRDSSGNEEEEADDDEGSEDGKNYHLDLTTLGKKRRAPRMDFSKLTPEEQIQWKKARARKYSAMARERQSKKEEALRAEVGRLQVYKTLVEAAPDAMLLLSNDAQGRILFANKESEKLFGFIPKGGAEKPLPGRCLWEWLDVTDRVAIFAAIGKVVLCKHLVRAVPCTVWLPSGSVPMHAARGPQQSLKVLITLRSSAQGLILIIRPHQYTDRDSASMPGAM